MKHPKYLLVIYSAVVLISAVVLFFNFPETSTKIKNYTLDANEQFVSVTAQKIDGQFGVLVFDMHSGEWLHIFNDKKLTAMGKFRKTDSNVLYVSSRGHLPDQFEGTDLLKCNLKSRECRYLFSVDGSISYPIDFPDQSILFVSSPIVWRGTENKRRIRFANKDFYLRSAEGRIDRLTYLEFYGLHSVSLSNDSLVFDADGPHNLPDGNLYAQRNYKDRSEIFKSQFNKQKREIQINTGIEKSLVNFGSFRDLFPSTMPDTSLVVFRSMRGGKPRIHSIVSYDENAKKIVDVLDLTVKGELSNPVLINKNTVIYMIIGEKQLQIFKRSISSKVSNKVGEINLNEMEFLDENSVLY